MRKAIDNIFLALIPILTIGIGFNVIPFAVLLLILVIRFVYTDKHTLGIILLLFGGILGSTIRFEFPFLPIYGLLLNFLGIVLVADQFKYIKFKSESVQMMAFVLIYFLLSYLLSPNINDFRATSKIIGIMQNGLFMYLAYYTIAHSPKINNEFLSQSLFLITMLFLVHNMNLLGIRPSNLFDYEWLRDGTAIFRISTNKDLFIKFINYQVIGMNALYGICFYLSKVCLDRKKVILYSIVALQLVLTSGARQAIFGYLIIVILRCFVLNNQNLKIQNLIQKTKYLIIVCVAVFLLLQILPLLGINYLTDTLSAGDRGREILLAMGMDLFGEYPIFGTGIGGFNHTYPGMLYPHNIIVEILCECGIVGFIILLSVLIFHSRYNKITLLHLASNNSFIFLIVAALGIRVMVSDDLMTSIGLFSAVIACTHRYQQPQYYV